MRSHLPEFQARLRSPRTAKTYGKIVLAFLDHVDVIKLDSITRGAIDAFLWRVRASGVKPSASTLNQELAALRVFSKFLVEHGERALPVADIPFEREAPRDPAVMTAGEVRRFFEEVAKECDLTRRARDLALLAVLTQLGLRVHEAVGLRVDQVEFESATLLAIRGKGGTVHDLPLNVETLTLLANWLERRPELARDAERALFVSRRGTRLSVRTVERLFEKLRAKIGSSKHITPHTSRHSVATLALSQGTDVVTVSQILRHASINTTMLYLHLIDGERRKAINRLGVIVPPELTTRAKLEEATKVAESTSENVPANDSETVDDHVSMDDVRPSRRAA